MSDETKHSSEPWRVTDWSIRDVDGMKLLSIRKRERVDARRIVAAVNAVAGIPIEALEAGALAKALASLAELVARRAAACEDNPFSRFEGSDGRYARAAAALRSLGRIKP